MSFRAEEIKELMKYRFGLTKTNSPLSINMAQFFQDDITDYMQKLKSKIEAASDTVAASIFSKRYAFFAVITLYAMSVYNKGIIIKNMENISVETDDDDQNWLPTIYLKDFDIISVQRNRGSWRNQIIENLFKQNLYLVCSKLYETTKLSKLVFWENIAVYIFWMYEKLLADPAFEEQRETIKDDFTYVIHEAEGALFGPYQQNPLTQFYRPKTFIPVLHTETRFRKTCCLSFLSLKGTKCTSCPCNCKFK